MSELKMCGCCGYPLTKEESSKMVEINGQVWSVEAAQLMDAMANITAIRRMVGGYDFQDVVKRVEILLLKQGRDPYQRDFDGPIEVPQPGNVAIGAMLFTAGLCLGIGGVLWLVG